MTINLKWLRGCATALVTPFRKDGSIDEDRFVELADRQIGNGVKILVPCGTTGESATMTEAERLHVIEMSVAAARKRDARVIAGTGSNCTASTVEFTRLARLAGADMALVVAPYYNKPTQEGLFRHFSEIAGSRTDFPIMIYNVPGRTASNIDAATTLRLARTCRNIVATKEASGDLSQIMEIIRLRPKNFRLFSGDDMSAIATIALGGDGLVSVCANEIPKKTSLMINAALDGEMREARRLHYSVLELMEANFLETSPSPCKFIMKEMGLLDEILRLPLVPVAKETRKKLRAVLSSLA